MLREREKREKQFQRGERINPQCVPRAHLAARMKYIVVLEEARRGMPRGLPRPHFTGIFITVSRSRARAAKTPIPSTLFPSLTHRMPVTPFVTPV